MEPLNWQMIGSVYTALAEELAASSWALRGILIGLAAVALLFVLLFATHLSRARALRVRRGEEIYRFLARRLGLSRSEQQMADRLSSFCRLPETRYMSLVEENSFEECTIRAQGRGTLEEITLSALRLKLEFGAGQPEGIPGSTEELAPGTPLIMVQKGRSSIRGKIGDPQAGALVVNLDSGVEPPTLGVPVSVYFHNPSGVFGFATHAGKLVGSSVHLDHSDYIRPTQRRRHYRKAVKLPVHVMLRDKLEEPISSAIVDLSGGGASLENPGMNVQPGSELALSFSPGGERFTVPARVVRLSNDGRIMHVQFQRLSESARDRLIASLFKARGRA